MESSCLIQYNLNERNERFPRRMKQTTSFVCDVAHHKPDLFPKVISEFGFCDVSIKLPSNGLMLATNENVHKKQVIV